MRSARSANQQSKVLWQVRWSAKAPFGMLGFSATAQLQKSARHAEQKLLSTKDSALSLIEVWHAACVADLLLFPRLLCLESKNSALFALILSRIALFFDFSG
jgi:hypothetical protein